MKLETPETWETQIALKGWFIIIYNLRIQIKRPVVKQLETTSSGDFNVHFLELTNAFETHHIFFTYSLVTLNSFRKKDN